MNFIIFLDYYADSQTNALENTRTRVFGEIIIISIEIHKILYGFLLGSMFTDDVGREKNYNIFIYFLNTLLFGTIYSVCIVLTITQYASTLFLCSV